VAQPGDRRSAGRIGAHGVGATSDTDAP
jgi:hypothetical protein